jgi:hypothetical protein
MAAFKHKAPSVVKRAGFDDDIGAGLIHPAAIGNSSASSITLPDSS